MCGSLDALCEDYKEEGKVEGFQLAAKICKELMRCVNITDEELAKKYHCNERRSGECQKNVYRVAGEL